MPEEWVRRNETEIDLFVPAEIISAKIVCGYQKGQTAWVSFIQLQTSITSSVLVAVKPGAVAYLKEIGSHHQMARNGFGVQKVTVEALFLREIRTRFGKFRLGYLWAILEPSAHSLILLDVLGYIIHRTMPDVSFPVFLLNGLALFFIFNSISKRPIGAIEAGQGLFNYQPVKPIDTTIAWTLLKILIYVAVYILLTLTVWVAGEYFEITSFL